MADASELLALAERCEAAAGPDRELDARIASALRMGAEEWAWADSYPAWQGRADGRVYLEGGGPSFAAPSYTASLDAAMTLVPEGCRRVEFGTYEGGGSYAYVHTPADVVGEADGAPNEPSALTAAALRARAAQMEA